jgi:hypothetical protein
MSHIESWVTDRKKISIDFLWTFVIIFSQVELLLSRPTYLTVTLEKFWINTGIVTFLTHILWVSLESWVTDRWNTSVDFLSTFQIICSRVALLSNRATYLPVTLEKIYYINSGIVTYLTHILCDSYWIMGDGRMEYIYWLLMNFCDNLLMSCTSIEQVNLPSSHIEEIYYINTRTVTFLTHILCVFSWIVGDGKMENIGWLLINFPDNLLTSCTSIEQVNLPSSHIGKIYYINTGIVTILTHILFVFSWIVHFYWAGQPT